MTTDGFNPPDDGSMTAMNGMGRPGPRRLIVGISGASGVVYGIRLLQLLKSAGIESHLVMSKAAEMTVAYETDLRIAEVKALAHTVHDPRDVGAAISSGSFRTLGMVVAPCSIRSCEAVFAGTMVDDARRRRVTMEGRRWNMAAAESPAATPGP